MSRTWKDRDNRGAPRPERRARKTKRYHDAAADDLRAGFPDDELDPWEHVAPLDALALLTYLDRSAEGGR